MVEVPQVQIEAGCFDFQSDLGIDRDRSYSRQAQIVH